MSWLKAREWASGVEYSSLFHSGLRAISLSPSPRSRAASTTSSSAEKRSRRSSVISLSSRLLKRRTFTSKSSGSSSTSTSTSPSPPPPSSAKKPRPSSMFVRPTKDLSDLWSTGGDIFTSDGPDHLDDFLPPMTDTVDPFSASPESRSFFVSLGDPTPTSTYIPPPPFIPASKLDTESFLSLASNSPELRTRALPRRERPVSMPLPPRSRRSSVHYRREKERERDRERLDPAWMLEESSPELGPLDGGDDVHIDVLHLEERADWRQFHVDWLLDHET
ncbi:hypothetical protein BJ138DRAFT_1006428 [Hygrophoropsis aurantiaca]|uniref:Uncharacterized protein n=1 Tax=Hygrophoropsis aurantiaca TaxID=72124 RepID=A0ACB8AFN0_9AGAM|nr:hypothetical protein BJ138DRAFT_1006428 [Hygrophoropsis aurantiaca]